MASEASTINDVANRRAPDLFHLQMSGQFEGYVDHLMSQGIGTGGVSKILSWTSLLALTFICSYLCREGLYFVTVLFLVLSLTRLSPLAALGCFVYLLVRDEWISAGALVIHFAISLSAIIVGKRNIKYLVFSGKPMINPFEGLLHLPLFLYGSCALLGIAIILNGWITILAIALFVLLLLLSTGNLWYRLRPQWSQVHHPLMFRYARCAAMEHVSAESEQRPYSFLNACRMLLESVYGDSDKQSETLLQNATNAMASMEDTELISQIIRKQHPGCDEHRLEEAMQALRRVAGTDDEDKRLLVRFSIAEVVEHLFGREERARYLLAVFAGEAH